MSSPLTYSQTSPRKYKSADLSTEPCAEAGPRILALFGEQFARQFMSESLTWLDHLIFAMVPLGIVAAVTGAIRVQGPHIAKAFVGRARENRALVEFELMSSTSHEVGEAFNGKGIIRVMGKPTIAEFLIFRNEYKAAEAFYDPFDGGEVPPTGKEGKKHALCGIQNLQSSIQKAPGSMQCSCAFPASPFPRMRADFYSLP